MKQSFIFSVCLVVVIGAFWIGHQKVLPQIQQRDLIGVIFGDARQSVGEACLHKADSYFHGGITIDYDAEENDSHTHEHAHHHSSPSPQANDLWARINAIVHVQEHKHLNAHESVELIPWLWASIHASPHTIEAYESAWFILATMQKQPDIALEMIDYGIQNNPQTPSLENTRGQTYYTYFKDLPKAKEAFLMAKSKALAGLKDAPKDESLCFELQRAFSYLIAIAIQQHQLQEAQQFLEEARQTPILPIHLKSLEVLLNHKASMPSIAPKIN